MSYKDYINSIKNETDNDVTLNDDKYVGENPVNDWDVNVDAEKLTPNYSDSNKDYSVSVRDVISSINNSKYKLSGKNVWLPDKNGNLVSLPDWVSDQPGMKEPAKQYRIEMISTQGNIIKDKNFTTVLKAIVYEDNIDVTDIKDKKYFKWSRFSGSTEKDQIADSKWNLKWAEGAKEIPITNDDVDRNAMFQVQFVTEKEAKIWETEALNTYMLKTQTQFK